MKEIFLDNKKIMHFKKITSTNTVLKEMARQGEAEGTILISEHQTNGRGRLGKSFFSPDGCGIYLSYLLRPEIRPENSVFITVAAAVALVNALKSVFSIDTKIKWVNDIYYNDKKLSGILTEGSISDNNTLNFAILGVGINIKTPPEGYPEEFSCRTTNLKEILGTEIEEEKKQQLIKEFIKNFDSLFSDDTRSYVKEYKDLSALIGREIEILSGEHAGHAEAVDIDENARLIVKKGGKKIPLDSGDVSIRFN